MTARGLFSLRGGGLSIRPLGSLSEDWDLSLAEVFDEVPGLRELFKEVLMEMPRDVRRRMTEGLVSADSYEGLVADQVLGSVVVEAYGRLQLQQGGRR